MKFATMPDGTLDGRLVVVSRDLTRCVSVADVAANLADALRRWDDVEAPLRRLSDALNANAAPDGEPFDPAACAAPLPRSPQWCDGSAFLNHGNLMDSAFDRAPIAGRDVVPLMYQGASDDFLGPCADVPLPREDEGIDFEGEFGVVVGAVPMGASAAEGLAAVRLVVLLNDWSLRGLGRREMVTGFGFFQAKPSTAFAPVAVTPDELDDAWRHGRVQLNLHIEWNGAWFGHPHGGEMSFSFGELIAHAAHTRRLTAGTIIGSGTVSNADRAAGSACIAERRAIELIDHGASVTGFMQFGDRVRMQARRPDGTDGPFGVIDQRVVDATGAAG